LDFASLYHFDLDGQVDEVRVWTIARSQQEIMDDMYAVLDGDEDGLAGYWGFDEGYGNMVQDLSGNGYDGTIVGAANWSENVPAGDSAPNYSLSFDGENDRIEIPNSDVLDITNELTLEAWIKPSVSYGTEAIIRKNSAFSLERQGTSAFGRVVIDGQGKMLWAYGALTGFENEWIHLAFTYDGSVATVYVNGEQFSSGTDFQGDIDTSNDNLLIGATLPEMENFQGGIDEARTWNYALNQDEIQSYINAPPTGDEQGLIGYWNFNEGDGDVVYDLSGNGNDGTIYGATWSDDVPGESNVARAVYADETEPLPETFALHQNYPNPFNPVTTINYDLPEPGRVHIVIYNILGKQVQTLVNDHQDAGYRSIRWNGTSDTGRRAAAGMYIYLIQAGDFIQSRKMILLK